MQTIGKGYIVYFIGETNYGRSVDNKWWKKTNNKKTRDRSTVVIVQKGKLFDFK